MFLFEGGLLEAAGGVLHNLTVRLNSTSFIPVVCSKYVNFFTQALGSRCKGGGRAVADSELLHLPKSKK